MHFIQQSIVLGLLYFMQNKARNTKEGARHVSRRMSEVQYETTTGGMYEGCHRGVGQWHMHAGCVQLQCRVSKADAPFCTHGNGYVHSC